MRHTWLKCFLHNLQPCVAIFAVFTLSFRDKHMEIKAGFSFSFNEHKHAYAYIMLLIFHCKWQLYLTYLRNQTTEPTGYIIYTSETFVINTSQRRVTAKLLYIVMSKIGTFGAILEPISCHIVITENISRGLCWPKSTLSQSTYFACRRKVSR